MTEFSINSGKGQDLTKVQLHPLSHLCAIESKWAVGEKVLSRWSDGLLYIGEILTVDDLNQRCLIRYEDLSVYWIMFKDIQKESFENSDIICCICNSGVSESPNEIVICDNCSAGYHQNCHVPRISATTLQLDDEWNCRQCVFASTARKGGASNTGSTAKTMQNFKQILPYDLKSLSWDPQHKRNIQQMYCYCGGPGIWLMKMLQCISCMQWFHEACIQCLERPLGLGDRFYLFICSACTSGPEFIQRLNLTWLELVHLVLFNLSMVEKKTYWDTEKIVNYIHLFWGDLQMDEKVKEPPPRDEIRKHVVFALENNRTKFKSGRETKKKATLWGLRCRSPPTCAPAISLSKEQLLAKKMLQSKSLKLDGLSFDINTNTRRLRSKSNDTDNYNSTGVYGSALEPFPTPPPEEPASLSECTVKKLRHRLKSALETTPTLQIQPEEATDSKNKDEEIHSSRKPLKKSTSKSVKRKRETSRALRSSTRSKSATCVVGNTSIDNINNSPKGTLNSIIPPPKNFDGQNNPFTTEETRFSHQPFRTTRQTGRNKNRADRRVQNRQLQNDACFQNVVSKHAAPVVIMPGYGDDYNLPRRKSSFSLICDPFVDCYPRVSITRRFYPGFGLSYQSAALSYNCLKNSVNNYFGAANRITSGEKFKVLASRVTQNGKLQYLIEWEGVSGII
ncbi:mitochondrial transcription factor 2 [Chamberlinius hualienensis]